MAKKRKSEVSEVYNVERIKDRRISQIDVLYNLYNREVWSIY